MLLHSKDTTKKSKTPLVVSLVILFLLAAVLKITLTAQPDLFGMDKKGQKAEEHTATPVDLLSDVPLDELLTSKKNQIASQDNFALYLNNELGAATLTAVYADSISKVEREGRFVVRLHLKDPSEWRKANQQKDYISLVKQQLKPIKKVIAERPYYVFRFPLKHPYFQFENLKRLQLIRDTREFGRFMVVSAERDSLPLIRPVSNGFKKLRLSLKSKAFEKIAKKRDEAVQSGVLISEDTDFVKAKVSIDEQPSLDADIRLKGDWTDHLTHESKWSYRIIPQGENTLFGMRKFSVQHPKSRNYLWEWLFNKVIKDNDITGLRYDFLNAEVHLSDTDSIISMGVMALEEGFDKILIENNRRREGLILAYEEDMIWEERKLARDMLLNASKDVAQPKTAELPIKVYGENKTLSNPVLAKQFDIAKNLMTGLRDGKLTLSEAFDVDKLTFYLALINLFGGHHGLIIHNVKIYYNPVTHKLEPISFDSNSGYEIQSLRGYPVGVVDDLFQEKLMENYKKVSSEEFISGFLEKYRSEMNVLGLGLFGEFEDCALDIGVLQHNANMIKKIINPSTSIQTTLLSLDNGFMTIEVKNFATVPMAVEGLVLKNGKTLNEAQQTVIVMPNDTTSLSFRLKKSFNNAFVSKKNKEGGFRYPKDLAQIRLKHHVWGTDLFRRAPIKAFSSHFEKKAVSGLAVRDNTHEFDFIALDEGKGVLHFKTGRHRLDKTLFIPPKYLIEVAPGFQLDFSKGASIISYAPIRALGTAENPIHFLSTDATGGGIFVSATSEASTLTHTTFSNLSIPQVGNWSLSGAVNFNEAVVQVAHCVFENNRSEDALNIIRTRFTMDSTRFQNTYSDAFDGDFVEGSITNSTFINSGNDGIDVSGSTLSLANIVIENPADKGLSAGEGSTMTGHHIKVSKGEIGVVSKDLSTITLTDVTIKDTRLGIACFQKKSEFGPGIVNLKKLRFTGIEVPYLIAENSDLTIDGVAKADKSANVIDKMYGNEYGKSSR
ncbi:MAG: CotH kinase family protein [Maribacter sp.]